MNKRAISLEPADLIKDCRQIKLEMSNMKRSESWQEGKVTDRSCQILRSERQQFKTMKVRKKEKNIVSQQQRYFVPFVQERDHIGRLLKINERNEGINQHNNRQNDLESLYQTNTKTSIERMIASYKESSREKSINHFISEKKDYRSKLDQIDVKYSLKVQPFRELLDAKIANTLEFKKGFKLSQSPSKHPSANKRQELNVALLEIINKKGEKQENIKKNNNICQGKNNNYSKVNTEGSSKSYKKLNNLTINQNENIISKEDSIVDLFQLTNVSKLSYQSCCFQSPSCQSKFPDSYSSPWRHKTLKHNKKEGDSVQYQESLQSSSFLSNTFQTITDPSVGKTKLDTKRLLLRSFTQEQYPNMVKITDQPCYNSLIIKRNKKEIKPADSMDLIQTNKQSKINVKSTYNKSLAIKKTQSFHCNQSNIRFDDNRKTLQIVKNLIGTNEYPNQIVSKTNSFQPFNSSNNKSSFNNYQSIKSKNNYSKDITSSQDMTRTINDSSDIQKCLTDIDEIDKMDLGFERMDSQKFNGISLADSCSVSLLRDNFSLTSQRIARIKRAMTETVEATKEKFKQMKDLQKRDQQEGNCDEMRN